MAMRVKSRWHRSRRNRPTPKGLEDNAGALAFIAWRLALQSAKNLHGEGFDYASDRERIAVVGEVVAFCIQVVDRLAHDALEDAEREHFVNALGQRLADHMQDNLVDIAGPGDYRRPFIELLNERIVDYSGLSFPDGAPGFDFLRLFGDSVTRAIGVSQTNRWVIDQVMEIEAPELLDKLGGAFRNLFG